MSRADLLRAISLVGLLLVVGFLVFFGRKDRKLSPAGLKISIWIISFLIVVAVIFFGFIA